MVASMGNPRPAKNEQAAPRWQQQRRRGVRLTPWLANGMRTVLFVSTLLPVSRF
jgi:hypothetical protein